MEAPPLDLPSAALVTQPGDILLTDSLLEEDRTEANKKKMVKTKGKRFSERINISTWNIRGLVHEQLELNQMQLDICVITETKSLEALKICKIIYYIIQEYPEVNGLQQELRFY